MQPAQSALLVLSLLVAGLPLSLGTQGLATFYGGAPEGMNPYSPSYGTLDGACGQYKVPRSEWPNWNLAGLSTGSKYYAAHATHGCGQCFRVTCVPARNRAGACTSTPSITVEVNDYCPNCNGEQLDLQALAFARIANPQVGNVQIDFAPTPCKPPGNLRLNVLGNSGANAWVKMGVEQVAGAGQVGSVQIKGPGAGWQSMGHTWGGVFETTSSPGSGPWSFHITTVDGKSTTCYNVFGPGQTGRFGTNCQIGGGGGGGGVVQRLVSKVQSHVKSSKCGDVPPPGGFSCARQKQWGKCKVSWMAHKSSKLPHGYCARTCKRC